MAEVFAGGGTGRASIGMRLRHTIRDDSGERIIFSGGRIGDDIHVDCWVPRPLSMGEARRIADALLAMTVEA